MYYGNSSSPYDSRSFKKIRHILNKMNNFDLNKFPEKDENIDARGEDDNGRQQRANLEIDLNELPKSEEDFVFLNISMWDIVYIFTAIYFSIALRYIR